MHPPHNSPFLEMVTVALGGWTVEVDVEATRTVAAATVGDDSCSCAGCRNFATIRSQAYPAEALDLLQRLGLDWRRESYVHPSAPGEHGTELYEGWFALVGKVISEAPAPPGLRVYGETHLSAEFEHVGGRFWARLRRGLRMRDWMIPRDRALSLDFIVEVPWVIEAARP